MLAAHLHWGRLREIRYVKGKWWRKVTDPVDKIIGHTQKDPIVQLSPWSGYSYNERKKK